MTMEMSRRLSIGRKMTRRSLRGIPLLPGVLPRPGIILAAANRSVLLGKVAVEETGSRGTDIGNQEANRLRRLLCNRAPIPPGKPNITLMLIPHRRHQTPWQKRGISLMGISRHRRRKFPCRRWHCRSVTANDSLLPKTSLPRQLRTLRRP